MKHLLALILLLSACIAASSQHKFNVVDVPYFNNKQDSVQYAEAQSTLRKIVSQQSRESADSVMKVIFSLRERIAGNRRVYSATPHFISYDSLLKMKDISDVKEVSLSNYKGKKIPARIFDCKNLVALELVDSRIKRLGKLKKLPQLSSVYLLNNNSVRALKLSKSASVKTLGIRSSTPEQIPVSFARLQGLEKLDLTSTDLKKFPSGLSKNKALKELLLGSNQLTELPTTMELLPSLERLELQRNKIQTIPASIRNLPKLKKLTLNYNSIESVDDAIGTLSQLEELSFYNNKLKTIPQGVLNLPKLRAVDFYYNQIERVDERIGNMKDLEVLYLSNNRIISLPESIGKLTNLSELYVSNNRLSDLPKSIQDLSKLKVLRLNNNYLTQCPGALRKLTMLENLDLSSNQITDLPTEVSDLSYLKLLVIMNNPWDKPALERLPAFTQQLRDKNVLVHSNDNN